MAKRRTGSLEEKAAADMAEGRAIIRTFRKGEEQPAEQTTRDAAATKLRKDRERLAKPVRRVTEALQGTPLGPMGPVSNLWQAWKKGRK